MRHLRHLACITVMLCSMIFGGAAAAENITLAVSPATVAIGDTVTVTVGTNAATAFVFWQVQLGFDSSKVQLATQGTGSFTTFTGDSRTLATINSSQYVTIGGDSAGISLTGNGTLAVFTFTATANGSAAYNLITYNASSQPLGTALVDPSFTFRMPAYSGSPASVTIAATATAPAITTQPGAASVTVGQTATFTVAASGTAPLTYQWQKNGTAISGATSASYTTPATVIGDNAATFRAVVTNSAGTATSNAAILTVTAAAAEAITLVVAPASVAVGDTVTVTISTTTAAPFVFWQARVAFDNTKVALATQATGTFATFTGDSRPLATINSSGFVSIAGDSAGVDQSGTGSLAVFTFTATAAGSPAFSLVAYNASTQPLGTTLINQALVYRTPAFTGSPATLTVTGAVVATVPTLTPTLTPTTSGSDCGLGGGLGLMLVGMLAWIGGGRRRTARCDRR